MAYVVQEMLISQAISGYDEEGQLAQHIGEVDGQLGVRPIQDLLLECRNNHERRETLVLPDQREILAGQRIATIQSM
jgi:hypothetical protein